MSKRFKWPQYPRDNAEFEVFMKAADFVLARRGFSPPQRSIQMGRLLWEAFQWSGNVLPDVALLNQPGFTGSVLLAKSQAWLREMYPHQRQHAGTLATLPVRLGQALWRMRMPVFWGRVEFFVDRNLENRGEPLTRGRPASVNLFRQVDDLPAGLALRLSDNELTKFFSLVQEAFLAILWWDELPTGELSKMARADFESSTAEILAGRYPQASWAAQQAAEKLIKSFHVYAGLDYLRSGLDGHDLEKLGADFKVKFDIQLPSTSLKAANWHPNGRYKTSSATEASALAANYAVLELVKALSLSDVQAKLASRSLKKSV